VTAADTESPDNWLIVGVVRKPHGVHGDVLVEILTDFPERLADGVQFGLGPERGPESTHTAYRVRYHKRRWLLSVEGVRDRETVEAWNGTYVYLPEQALEDLPEGYYYEHHLVGLQCRTPAGDVLGSVTGVESDGPQTRLVVRRDKREYLVPYVPEIVVRVDLEAGIVEIDAPRGLLDDDAVS
jgi:16S rRNA processing protein RimM